MGILKRLTDWLASKEKKPDRILVDREGVAYLPTTEVRLQAKKPKRKKP